MRPCRACPAIGAAIVSIVLTVVTGIDASNPLPTRRRTRDPEDRPVEPTDRQGVREKMLDKTVADSFPASDPPSSIPDPESDSF
jgi:hypothetical protein